MSQFGHPMVKLGHLGFEMSQGHLGLEMSQLVQHAISR